MAAFRPQTSFRIRASAGPSSARRAPRIVELIAQTFEASDPRRARIAERELIEEHHRHFAARVRGLPPYYFPGGESSPSAVRSLSNGTYAFLRRIPRYGHGSAAFRHVLTEKEENALGFLYYWRTSATMDFLRSEASPELRLRMQWMRNVQIHLREGFRKVGTLCGEPLWWIPDEKAPARPTDPSARPQVGIAPPDLRGKSLIRAVLVSAAGPLTRAEIVSAILSREHLAPPEVPDHGLQPDAHLAMHDLERAVQAFWKGLEEDERLVLIRRGYGQGRPQTPFREVAERIGRLHGESWRTREKRALLKFAQEFPAREDAEAAAAVLADVIGKEVEG